MTRLHNIVEVTAELRRETEKAYLLYDGKKEVWVPKELCEDYGDGTFQMPDWLALDKGLI